jgi:SAM-dependent methyltransferase
VKKTQTFFDVHAHHHAYRKAREFYVPVAREIQERRFGRNLRILDIGCGDCNFIRDLIGFGIDAEFYGTDLSRSMIDMSHDLIKSGDEEEGKSQIVEHLILAYEKLGERKQDEFRFNLRKYVNNYTFLTQITNFSDPIFEGNSRAAMNPIAMYKLIHFRVYSRKCLLSLGIPFMMY